ncbi:MAG: hypothetical protein ACP5TJ_02045 [Candidatus Micrarchaeia archaeon]
MQKLMAYAFYALALLVFAATIFSRNYALLLLVSFFLLLSSLYFGASKFLNAQLLALLSGKLSKTVSGPTLSVDAKAVIKRKENAYVAIAAAELRAEKQIDQSTIASILNRLSFDFDYVVSIRQLDSKKFTEGLELRKRLKEIEIEKCNRKNYNRLNELRQQLDMIESEIAKISGSKPLSAKILLKTFAENASPYIAAKEACTNMETIASSFSSEAGFSYTVLKGEDLLLAVE